MKMEGGIDTPEDGEKGDKEPGDGADGEIEWEAERKEIERWGELWL